MTLVYYKWPHISKYLINNAVLSEKLPILAYPCQPSENSYKPYVLCDHSSLVRFLSLTVKAYVHSVMHGSSESNNIQTSGVTSGNYTNQVLKVYLKMSRFKST